MSSFYEDYQKSLKKAESTKSNLFSALPKLKPEAEFGAYKPYSNKNTNTVLKNSSEYKSLLNLPDPEKIKPRKPLSKPSFIDPDKMETLIGNPNEKNEPVKFPLFNPEKTKIDKGFTKYPYYTREGLRIKNNVQSILKNRIGELDSRHIFDGIDDDTIERNKPVAQAAIEDNIRKGLVTQEQLEKYPNMLDAMTMFYAAGEKGKPKAQNLARSVAYSEEKYPDIIPTDIKLLSNDITATDLAALYATNELDDDVVVQNKNAGKRYVGADGVRIRNGYGLDSTAMGLLNEGDEVEYTGRKTSEEIDGHYWAEIVHDSKTYWIAADYLTVEKNGESETEESLENDNAESESDTVKDYGFNANIPIANTNMHNLSADTATKAGTKKVGDSKYSESVIEEIDFYDQIWHDAEVAYSLGIINEAERDSVQHSVEDKCERIRHEADHPFLSFLDGTAEFNVFDLTEVAEYSLTAYAADLSGPAFKKMYEDSNNYTSILKATALLAGFHESVDKGRTLINIPIEGNRMARVDIEFGKGKRVAELHVQLKGKGENGIPFKIASEADIEKLPKVLRKNTRIINTIKKGLKTLSKIL